MASGLSDENVLEEIMERLLERESANVGNNTMEIDDDPNLSYDHERDATVRLIHSFFFSLKIDLEILLFIVGGVDEY